MAACRTGFCWFNSPYFVARLVRAYNVLKIPLIYSSFSAAPGTLPRRCATSSMLRNMVLALRADLKGVNFIKKAEKFARKQTINLAPPLLFVFVFAILD